MKPKAKVESLNLVSSKTRNNQGGKMVLFQDIVDGLTRALSMKSGRYSFCVNGRIETVEASSTEMKKNELISVRSGVVKSENSQNLSSIFSKKGQKGSNQDSLIVWEEFGCQEDMIFCGIFDGHGQWGHFVSERVRESFPRSLLRNWQEMLVLSSLNLDFDANLVWFDTWKQAFLKTYEAIDIELKENTKIDSFQSGCTSLTIVKQGDCLAIANVGDSRAVLATNNENGTLSALQLTVDSRPDLPEEAERIIRSQGRVFCLEDEPGVYRVWLPNGRSPGLAVSRAFGDYCVKEFGLVSIPHFTQRTITTKDHFLILATDGVWDVISNEEAVEIVWSSKKKEKSAKRLVKCASTAWRSKKRGIAVDDISAICLFFNYSNPPLLSNFSNHYN